MLTAIESPDLVTPPASYYSNKIKETTELDIHVSYPKARSFPIVRATHSHEAPSIIASKDSEFQIVFSYLRSKSHNLTADAVSKAEQLRLNSRYTLESRIQTYSNLIKGWDGDRANPVLPQAISNAKKFINTASLSVLNEININDIFATPNGTVTFEVSRGEDSYLVVDIGNESVLYYYRHNNDLEGLDESVPFNEEAIASICNLFKEFSQAVCAER